MYRENKEEAKAYVIIFTCAAMRAVHLELTKSQLVDECQAKLNAFITRRTRPETLISDNGRAFKATAEWICFDEVKDYITIWHNKKSPGNLMSVKLHGT